MPVVKLYPVKDAYVSNLDYSNHNESVLHLGPSYRSYFQFDVSSIPTSATINGVYLNLYSLTTGKMGGYCVYTCTSPWEEALIKNGNEPTSVLENNKPLTIWPSVNGWINAIRPLDTVKRHIKGTSLNYGFYVDAYENDCEYLEFASKEYSDSTKCPYLEIDYSMPLPNTPSNLSPTGGAVLDRAKVQRLSWQHNPAKAGEEQTKFDLQWRLQGTADWNTVSLNTVNQYWDAPVGTFPYGMIEWQVRTYDQYSQASSYSAISLFYAGDKPSKPVVTSPTNGSLISGPQLIVSWTSTGQAEYNLRLTDINGNVLWEDTKASIDKTKIVGYTLANNTSYKIQLRVKNADGLWSDFAESSINVVYATVPPPVVSITPDAIRGSLKLDIRNEIPPINLIDDGDCEKLDKWTTQFGTNVLDSSNKVFGTNSIKYTVTSSNGEHFAQYAGTIQLKPYATYCLSAYIKPINAKGYLRAVIIKNNGTYDSGAEGGTTGDITKFSRCFIKFKTGSDPKYIYLRIQLTKSDGTPIFTGTSEAAYFDGVMLHEITEAEYNNASYQPPTFTMNTTILDHNEIYRRQQGETNWLRIAKIPVNTVYIDFTLKHLQTYEYKARAVTETLAYADSNVTLASVTVSNSQLALVSDFSKWVELKASPQKKLSIQYDRDMKHFAGRKYPVSVFTEQEENTLALAFKIMDDTTLDKLMEIIEARQTMLYRDSSRRRMFGTVAGIGVDDQLPDYYLVNFNVDRVDYIEEV